MKGGMGREKEANGASSPARRKVLKGLIAGSAASAATIAGAAAAATPASASRSYAGEADVLIVGSGAAGTAAALAAAGAGSTVILLEKMPFEGGTTAKSGGVFWIPNNPVQRGKNVTDAREDALKYMVRLSYPSRYVATDPTLGITQPEFDLIAAFYDNASHVVEALMGSTGLKAMEWTTWDNQAYPDYFANIPENKVHRGRSLVPDVNANPERAIWPGGGGSGDSLLWQLKQSFAKLPIQVLIEHRVLDVIRNDAGAVCGLTVDRGDPQPVSFRAKKAVVFATGGFTHNVELARNFLKGPIWGGCAAPGSTGDFIPIAQRAGARLGNMSNAWWGQVPVEAALKTRSVAADIWSTPGDSMIQVNRYGRRFANEKIQYNERCQAHFTWDPVRAEYPNIIGFMIWDARTAQAYAGYDPVPAANAKSPHVIEGATLAALAEAISQRLATLETKTGGVKLDADFAKNLEASVKRFNGFAKKGKDEDFARGESPIEHAFQFMNAKQPANPYPSIMMHPIADKGPYYCVMLGAGTLDTKGGPVVNPKGQVLDAKDAPIPGLYAAGNCVAHPAGQAYWAGGGTIGPAMTFGYLAGTAAAAEPVKTA